MSGTHEDLLMRAVHTGRSLGYDDAADDACLISLSLAPHGAHQDRVPPSLSACSPGLSACLPAPRPALPLPPTALLGGGLGRQGWWGVLSWRVGGRR